MFEEETVLEASDWIVYEVQLFNREEYLLLKKSAQTDAQTKESTKGQRVIGGKILWEEFYLPQTRVESFLSRE